MQELKNSQQLLSFGKRSCPGPSINAKQFIYHDDQQSTTTNAEGMNRFMACDADMFGATIEENTFDDFHK